MAIDATISGTASNSYLTLADTRERLNAFAPSIQRRWDEVTSEDLWEWLLRKATNLIDQYTLWGPKKVDTQKLRFPRGTDSATAIPEEVKAALVEYVAFYLDGSMIAIKNLQQEGVTNASLLGQSTALEKERTGLPAGSRRELDQLKLSDWPAKPLHRDTAPNTLPGQSVDGVFFGGPG